jgi:hypothetical protein
MKTLVIEGGIGGFAEESLPREPIGHAGSMREDKPSSRARGTETVDALSPEYAKVQL